VTSGVTVAPARLPRALGLRGAVALGIGGTIGGGIYVLIGRAAGEAGPGALLSFAIAFAASLLIALPYAELACRYPLAGGGYAFARAVFGRRTAFLMGWGFWGAYLFISGYVTLGFGGYLHTLTGLPVLAGALCVIAVCLAFNLLGVRVTGGAQALLMSVAIAALLSFVVWGAPDVNPGHFHPFLPSGLPGLLSASVVAFLAFGGFDMVAAAGEEIHRPERNLPRAILITLVAVLGLYLLVCFVAIGVSGSRELGASSAPLAGAAHRFGGAPARGLLILTALLTTAATANAVLVVTSRISFAMARDSLLPRALASINDQTGAPWAALILSATLLAIVACTGSITLAASAGGFLYVLHFLLPLIALVALRRRGDLPRSAFRTPAPRVTLPLAFLACAVLLAASGRVGATGGVAWLALGALGYGISRQRRVAPGDRRSTQGSTHA
jgi:APA family basic amino acid/polyamine antiporter